MLPRAQRRGEAQIDCVSPCIMHVHVNIMLGTITGPARHAERRCSPTKCVCRVPARATQRRDPRGPGARQGG